MNRWTDRQTCTKYISLYICCPCLWFSHDFTTMDLQISLALLSILNCKMDDFTVLIALLCSSFVTVSAGTHQRTPWFPLGQCTVPFVKLGNLLATRSLGSKWGYWWDNNGIIMDLHLPLEPSCIPLQMTHTCLYILTCQPRVSLLILVISAMNGCWILEQPRSSLLAWHPRVRWLFRQLPKVPFVKT